MPLSHSSPPIGSAAAGYAWLIDTFALRVPTPVRVAFRGKHRTRELDGWTIKPEQYAPAATFSQQITFALKWEGVNLAVLPPTLASMASAPKKAQ